MLCDNMAEEEVAVGEVVEESKQRDGDVERQTMNSELTLLSN